MIDLQRFRADLSEAGVEEMFEELLATFVEDAPKRFAAIEQALLEQNSKAVERAGHAFKSAAGTIRANFLSGVLAMVEAAGRTGRLARASELMEEIQGEYLTVMREIEEVIHK